VPLCFSAAYGPGWLIAATWQVTIVAGSLLSPMFSRIIITTDGPIRMKDTIPVKGLLMSLIILFGVAVIQLDHANHLSFDDVLLGMVPVFLAAFAYPLGNRKMMEVCEGRMDACQRVLGMTIASLPLWIPLWSTNLLIAALCAPLGGWLVDGQYADFRFIELVDLEGCLPSLICPKYYRDLACHLVWY
jgi:hypothetical protein